MQHVIELITINVANGSTCFQAYIYCYPVLERLCGCHNRIVTSVTIDTYCIWKIFNFPSICVYSSTSLVTTVYSVMTTT